MLGHYIQNYIKDIDIFVTKHHYIHPEIYFHNDIR